VAKTAPLVVGDSRRFPFNQENFPMSELDNNKRKNLGTLPIAKLEKMAQWKTYATASAAFAKAKQASSEAKSAVREALKKRVSSLKSVENLEFYVNADGEHLRI
jgi:hypothetical protein